MSGEGTNLQALIDAAADPGYGATLVAVGSDRPGIRGLERAQKAGLPTFVTALADHPDRAAWDQALTARVQSHEPGLVVLVI